ncbi:MAG: DUF4157 domain-containing protein, partial [Anaerolineales bacterium]
MTTPPSQTKNEQAKKTAPVVKPAGTVSAGMEQAVSSQSLTAALENPQAARPETILKLQRISGNRAVTDLIQHNGLTGIRRAGEEEDEKLQAKSLAADPLAALEAMRGTRAGVLGLAKPGLTGEAAGKAGPQPAKPAPKAEPPKVAPKVEAAPKAKAVVEPVAKPKPMVAKAAAPVKPAVLQPARSHGVLSRGVPQAKLTVSEPGDQQEIEADQVAEQVMKMPALATPPPPDEGGNSTPNGNSNPNDKRPAILNRYLQRAPVQRSADGIGGGTVSDDVQSRIEGMQQGGKPLPDSEREFFEPRMGVDLSNVRVHTDSTATETSKELNARAYTVGPHVAFNSGEFQPGTTEGRRLLGHELTHVVQQGGAAASEPGVQRDSEKGQKDTQPGMRGASTVIQAKAEEKQAGNDGGDVLKQMMQEIEQAKSGASSESAGKAGPPPVKTDQKIEQKAKPKVNPAELAQ